MMPRRRAAFPRGICHVTTKQRLIHRHFSVYSKRDTESHSVGMIYDKSAVCLLESRVYRYLKVINNNNNKINQAPCYATTEMRSNELYLKLTIFPLPLQPS